MPARLLGTSPTALRGSGRWRHLAAAVPASALALGLLLTPVTAGADQAVAGTYAPVAPATSALHGVAPQLFARHPLRSAPRVAVKPTVDRAALVLRLAAALRGRPYHYGAVGPRSFDCSGFTRYVFGRAVHRSLPHSSAAQYRLSHKIAKSAIRPGDLVFFVSGGHVYHVGIYAGHGLIWHAPHTGDHVRLAAISTSSWVAGRVL